MRQLSFARLFPSSEDGAEVLNALVDEAADRQARVGTGYDPADRSVRCPQAEALIARHVVRHAYGITGCAQLFSAFDDPGRYKRKAAETIIRVRCTRRCQGHGRNSAEARLLTQAAAYRRRAAALLDTPMPKRTAVSLPQTPSQGKSLSSKVPMFCPEGRVP